MFLVDIMDKVLTEPAGATRSPGKRTEARAEGRRPDRLRLLERAENPPDKLQVITLIKGTGTKVAKGDTTVMDYLGSVYGSKEVFDKSYSKDRSPHPSARAASSRAGTRAWWVSRSAAGSCW